MSEGPHKPGPQPHPQPAGQVADLLDKVAWDFDPEDDLLSPLVSTERYFRDFPWNDHTEE